jgi:HD-GYP domain-containing protein (c-di-GMP phosphodiesterase class II)
MFRLPRLKDTHLEFRRSLRVAVFFVFGLSRSATILWLAVVAGGLCVLGVCLAIGIADLNRLPIVVLFVVAAAIAESFMVVLPTSRPGNAVFFSVGAAASVAAILVFPFHWAVVVVALGMAIGHRTVWFKRLYNAGQITVSAATASLAWQWLRGSSVPSELSSVPGVIAAVATYFLVTTVLTAAIVALASGMPARTTWWRSNRNTWPASLGMLFIGVLIAVLWVTSPWAIALAAIPLTAIYYTLRNTVSLETQTVDALFNLADILDARDTYTHGHSLRVGQYAEQLALSMRLSGDDAHLIFLAGRLHDIGKCAIKNEVLLKPSALNAEEFEHMCIHPEVGASMLAPFSLFRDCARFVRGHHERWDGNGYPDRLQGENIPLGARIIAVVDAFDAMTTTRPYRNALPVAEAHRRLEQGAGTQWDARIVGAFLRLLDTTSIGLPEPLPLPIQPTGRKAA